jgi:PadR family transcriptional regulator, regulatory protein PadR
MALRARGVRDFHGFQLAKELQSDTGASHLTGHGTLYKALERLEELGLVESRWEDPAQAAEQGRPRRRLYVVTVSGARALAERADEPSTSQNQWARRAARA